MKKKIEKIKENKKTRTIGKVLGGKNKEIEIKQRKSSERNG